MANLITFLRLCLIPVFIWLMIFYPEQRLLALAVFGVAALSDWLDGVIARSLGKITKFGKVFDPLVDRLFILSVASVLCIRQLIGFWVLAIFLARDAIMIIGYQILRVKKEKLAVTFLGKVTTVIVLVAFLGLLAGLKISIWLVYLGLMLYLISGLDYILRGAKLLKS